MTPNRIWIGIFAVWGLLLSGFLSNVIGSPGVIQAVRLKILLDHKQAQAKQVQDLILSVQSESALLESSRAAQQREVRKVLGYAAPDEIIFDFSNGERI